MKWNGLAVRAMERVVDLIEAADPDGAEAFWRNHLFALGHVDAELGREPLVVQAPA